MNNRAVNILKRRKKMVIFSKYKRDIKWNKKQL